MMNLFKHPGVLTIAYLLSRVLLSPLSPVPGAVALDPLWIFALLLRRDAGKGWMFSLIPGLVFGDWMCGFAAGQIFMRLTGFVALGGLLPLRGGFNRQYFLMIFSHGLWSSLMPDWMGYFPLGYVYIVWILQGVLWWGIAPREKEETSLKPVLPLLTVPVGLLLLHLFLSAPKFLPLPQLGDHSGLPLQILAGFLLLPPFLVWYLNRKKPREPEVPSSNPSGGRWTHLAE